MEETPTVASLTLALLTAPALAGGISAEPVDEQPSIWLPEDKLAGTEPGANVGADVALEGDTAVVGSPNAQKALVYERGETGWSRVATLTPDGDAAGFGAAVAIDGAGSAIVVGAPFSSTVHVFETTGDGWGQTARLTAPGSTCLGYDVAVQVGTILAGAPCWADEVHVFDTAPSTWEHTEVISGDGVRYGWALAMDEGLAVIGNMGEDAEVVTHEDDGWTGLGTLTPPAGLGERQFAWSVDIDGDRVAVGVPSAPLTPAETGAVHVYDSADGPWTHVAALTATDATSLEPPGQVQFGYAVALEGDRLIVGAPGDDRLPGTPSEQAREKRDPACMSVPLSPTCKYPGAAYAFRADTSGWYQTSKLSAPDGAPTESPRILGWDGRPDAFGASIALDGDMLTVGAPHADLLPGDDAGAAYVYASGIGGAFP